MIYSVFDYIKGNYTYYEAQGLPPAAGTFRSPGPTQTPESLAVKLPANAAKVGEGPTPKGVIASTNPSALAAYTLDSDFAKYALAAGTLVLGFILGRR